MASKVTIKKCNDHDVNIPVHTSNDIYRLKTRSSKDNHYLVIFKDCTIYVKMLENERILFKTVRKMIKQHVPRRTSAQTCGIHCCIT